MVKRLATGAPRTSVALAAAVALVSAGVLMAGGRSEAHVGTVGGSIEIDANLHPGGSSVSCSAVGGTLPSGVDWVKDCQSNTDTPSHIDSIATGIEPGVTGRSGGFGHWNGLRVVDGIKSNDDIFLTGGKENDTDTWNVGPGSVGSSKYDATQAYIGNNQTELFFGMERRGNNGTTAFDFEFNQDPPLSTYIPDRSVDDVLLTFEMQGSGGSGSAVPHYYTWDGDSYNEQPLPSGVTSVINENTTTPAAPWGHVDGNGNWVGGNLARFEFAEAKVPLSLLPGIDACGGHAYTEVRTRSSSTENSDLKDTSKIFRLDFATPSVTASKTGANGSTGTVTVSGSASGMTNPSYQWQRLSSSGWVNITNATSSTFNYSSFEADSSPSAISFGLSSGSGAGNYVGRLYQVQLRLHASGAGGCQADSPAVTVKKIIAVDP